ncbi:MAG: YccF domain-containing protein [Humidesulfovibrio sp.]|nr:YccF domain-containing protein [Humidesulfovibrio sp.]
MKLLGNIIWFLFGGLVMGLGWYLLGLVMFASIVGIPWGRACFMLGGFCLWPFGREIISRRLVTGRDDIGTGLLGFVGNAIWFLCAGLWLAIGHLGSALLCFITIIGIPFGLQHLKLAVATLAPIGKTVVETR